MWEVYFDDSGTHDDAEFVVAACYISRVNGWRKFVEEYDLIRDSEEFNCFHMAEFAARHNKKFKPWCDWEAPKRERVYRRIAGTINRNKFIGFGFALPSEPFDRLLAPLPDWLKFNIGPSAYTFAVRCLMGNIGKWRKSYGITLPMQYVFDMQTS